MPTIRDRILTYLAEHPEGAYDSELTQALHLPNHAQANQRCRDLAAQGLITRQRIGGKLRNFSNGVPLPAPASPPEPVEGRPWSWEGNVQQMVITYLQGQGYKIISFADTATHQRGKDIVAESADGTTLWVTVKGYPRGTDRTNPSLQAALWFKDALFDMVVYRGEDSLVQLAMALPDFPRYHTSAGKVRWLQPIARFSYLWVSEDGRVTEEPSLSGGASKERL